MKLAKSQQDYLNLADIIHFFTRIHYINTCLCAANRFEGQKTNRDNVNETQQHIANLFTISRLKSCGVNITRSTTGLTFHLIKVCFDESNWQFSMSTVTGLWLCIQLLYPNLHSMWQAYNYYVTKNVHCLFFSWRVEITTFINNVFFQVFATKYSINMNKV